MANDNGDNNNEEKKGKGLGNLLKKAGKVFSKKTKNQEEIDVSNELGKETQEFNATPDVNTDPTEEFQPAFNRLDDIQETEDQDTTAPIIDTEPTKPSFQVADFADEEEEDEEIERTLKSIHLPKKDGLGKVKSSLSSLFKRQPPSPLHEHEKKKTKVDFGVIWRKISKKLRSSPTSESKSFAQFYQDFFSPNSRPTIHRNFILLLFLCGAFLSARLLTTVLTPAPTFVKVPENSGSFYNQGSNIDSSLASLEKNDLFKAKVIVPDQKSVVKKKKPIVDENLVCKEANRKSSLGVKLVKTIVLQDSVKSIASVQVRGKDNHLRIGDRIPGMAEIGFIDGDKLIFKNLKSGLCEYVESPKTNEGKRKKFNIEKNLKKAKKLITNSKKTGIKNDGNTYKIKKSVRDELLGDISNIITQARAIPIKNPDGTYCFRMVEIVTDSIYTKLGVQNQDIICNINGRKMESLNEAMGLLGKLKTNDRFELGVTRNGSEQTFEYNFE